MDSHGRAATHIPRDELYLWFLAIPTRPVLVGTLHMVRTERGVSLRYTEDWLTRGFALSSFAEQIDRPFLRDQRQAFLTSSSTYTGSH
jgi:hypothetical protein